MKSLNLKSFFAAALLFAVCLQVFAFIVPAQKLRRQITDERSVSELPQTAAKNKIAPDLEERTAELFNGLRGDEMQKVIIRVKPETPLNEMPGNSLNETERNALFSKEVENNISKEGLVKTDLAAVGGTFNKSFNHLGLVSAELPLSQIRELIKSETVDYLSTDSEVESLGHVSETLGYYNQGINDKNDADPNTWLDGSSVHVAVIDSGVYDNHTLLKWSNTYKKVKKSVDFTGQGRTDDPFGHGTHVASILAGDWEHGNSAYEGLAGGTNVINLRALDNTGKGSISTVIAAIDWAIANEAAWNIRVINMSLGMAPKDSYLNDPLCQAARRAVNAGIVVVTSAGNFGKDSNGEKIYGAINSPGIEPSVITVGAANTFGSDIRTDDGVATFSSRGPTRGYTMVNGARKYDNLVKPDLIAPGNKIIGASSPNNAIVTANPSLATGNYTLNTEKVMYLSGTSMAAPQVAGAAALLLETNPNLTPNLVKAILMYTAQPLKNFNTFEQGAGLLNVDGAVRVTRLVKANPATLANGGAMLTTTLPASQTSLIAGTTVSWGKGIVTNFGVLYGNELMTKWQAMYGNGVLISDGTTMSGSSLVKVSAKTTAGVSLYQGTIKNNGVLISDGTLFMGSSTMSNGSTLGQGVLISDGVLVSDGVLISDGGAMSTSALFGDNTACMLPAP